MSWLLLFVRHEIEANTLFWRIELPIHGIQKHTEKEETNGYDTFTFGDGLMLSHFAYDKQYWEYNSVNTVDNKMRAYIIPADNEQLNYSAHKENL